MCSVVRSLWDWVRSSAELLAAQPLEPVWVEVLTWQAEAWQAELADKPGA